MPFFSGVLFVINFVALLFVCLLFVRLFVACCLLFFCFLLLVACCLFLVVFVSCWLLFVAVVDNLFYFLTVDIS